MCFFVGEIGDSRRHQREGGGEHKTDDFWKKQSDCGRFFGECPELESPGALQGQGYQIQRWDNQAKGGESREEEVESLDDNIEFVSRGRLLSLVEMLGIHIRNCPVMTLIFSHMTSEERNAPLGLIYIL